MYRVDVYLPVRRAVMVEGMSIREASRVFGLHRDTVRKMLAYSVPPGYRRQATPHRPKLETFTGVIDRILEDDLRVPRKQPHTAKRIYERLRDEYGFDGGYTIVKDYVREHRRRTQEMFVPLSHPSGHAQCDFGEARVIIGGVERKAHYFVLDLPHSDGCFVKAYSAETTGAFLDGHAAAFAFLGGVPQSILYDNTRLAVARILGDGRRQRGLSVGFTTAAGLVHELMEARDERRLLNLQRQLSRLGLLIIDELGFVPLSPTGAELLFEVFSQRYERGSILVTTNLPFDEWTEVFGSDRLTGALLDRLTHHVHILEMNGDSYRLRHSRENAASQVSDNP